MNKYSLKINGNSVLVAVKNCLGMSREVFRGSISDIENIYSFEGRISAFSPLGIMLKTRSGKKITLFSGMFRDDAEEAVAAVNAFIAEINVWKGF
ncbi:MAG: hypothetical protein MJ234_05165 [bacterium]|nr:hypothetical protein [bacterium]